MNSPRLGGRWQMTNNPHVDEIWLRYWFSHHQVDGPLAMDGRIMLL
jgi:hypothetical protein